MLYADETCIAVVFSMLISISNSHSLVRKVSLSFSVIVEYTCLCATITWQALGGVELNGEDAYARQ